MGERACRVPRFPFSCVALIRPLINMISPFLNCLFWPLWTGAAVTTGFVFAFAFAFGLDLTMTFLYDRACEIAAMEPGENRLPR